MKNTSPKADRSAYPVNEGAYRLGIGRSSLYAMAKSGELKLVKIAGRTLVPASEIERLTQVNAGDAGR